SHRAPMMHAETTHRTTDPAGFALAELVILNLFKTGSNMTPAPAWDAGSSPIIVILCLALYVEHTVNRARATKNPARHEEAAPLPPVTLRKGGEVPRQSRIAKGSAVPTRHMNQPAIVLRTCLDYKH